MQEAMVRSAQEHEVGECGFAAMGPVPKMERASERWRARSTWLPPTKLRWLPKSYRTHDRNETAPVLPPYDSRSF